MAPDVARSAEPGHFVMLRLHEGGERIPLTVADYDRDKGTITMVIQALGKTTLEMRDHYKAGDTIVDFVGPLGLPQHVSQAGHVVLVGGGLGVAPVYPQLRAFKAAGNRTTGIIGFRNKDLVFWEEKLRPLLRQPDRLHRRRQLRQAGVRHRGAAGGAGERPAGPGHRHRAAADDERLRRNDAAVQREDHGVAERDHGRRHRHVRLVPRHRRQRDQVRLRRRPRLRRPPGRLQGTDAAPEALQGRGGGGQHRLRACVQRREAAVRAGQDQLQEVQGPGAAGDQDARARSAGALAQLQGSQPRLLDGRRAGRGRALHHVQQGGLHRRLPGVDRHPALHPPPAGARHRRRAGRHQRIEPVPVGLRPRLPAGIAVRGAVRRRPQARVGGDRPAGALRRRQRQAAEGRAAALRARARQGGDRRLRPVGAGGGGRPRALRLRRHRLRGAARGRRRAAVRHPVVPPAARDHQPRGRQPQGAWASSSRPTR